ncbi:MULTISPECIES: hypothetical protein [unclassified Streptomyces]|uniref:hypothetical protein n=1 Tax=unclassified Streptomyces TaxID=2593676 RepID=UPI001EF4B9B9|nr:hypothetical protein [Streptomyces sp. CS065A]
MSGTARGQDTVVGADPRADRYPAVRWAADEARLRAPGRRLVVAVPPLHEPRRRPRATGRPKRPPYRTWRPPWPGRGSGSRACGPPPPVSKGPRRLSWRA